MFSKDPCFCIRHPAPGGSGRQSGPPATWWACALPRPLLPRAYGPGGLFSVVMGNLIWCVAACVLECISFGPQRPDAWQGSRGRRVMASRPARTGTWRCGSWRWSSPGAGGCQLCAERRPDVDLGCALCLHSSASSPPERVCRSAWSQWPRPRRAFRGSEGQVTGLLVPCHAVGAGGTSSLHGKGALKTSSHLPTQSSQK